MSLTFQVRQQGAPSMSLTFQLCRARTQLRLANMCTAEASLLRSCPLATTKSCQAAKAARALHSRMACTAACSTSRSSCNSCTWRFAQSAADGTEFVFRLA